MTDETSFPYLRVTIDDALDDMRELSGHKKERLWVTKAWEALRALNDYVRYQLTHPENSKPLHDYLRDQPDGFFTIPVKRMAAHESDTVQNRAKFSGNASSGCLPKCTRTGWSPCSRTSNWTPSTGSARACTTTRTWVPGGPTGSTSGISAVTARAQHELTGACRAGLAAGQAGGPCLFLLPPLVAGRRPRPEDCIGTRCTLLPAVGAWHGRRTRRKPG